MAPISPISRKRPSPLSEASSPEGPKSKKRRVLPDSPQTQSPEEPPYAMNVSKKPLFNDNPHELLKRSVAAILEHVGFSGASPESFEALCAQVDTYASHFISEISASATLARRNELIPLDFDYALAKFNLPLASLEPHLKPPIDPPNIIQSLEPAPEKELDRQSLIKLLGQELDGGNDKQSRPYIPSRFPAFPSKHTYKWTEQEPTRETDPRKIREEAAKSAKSGEEALRRLVKVSKAGREKDVKRVAEKDPKSKMRHELWEQMMGNFTSRKLNDASVDQEDDRSMVVNSESQYFRKPVQKKRSAVIQSEG